MSVDPLASLRAGPRIAIVGIGKVGAAAAYSIIHRGIASEVVILDVREDFQNAQVQDLRDSTSFGLSPRVRAGTWRECGQCDIIVFTAGTNQKAGESRLALIQRNIGVVRSGLDQMKPFKEDAILLVVTNPVDIMTYFALKYSGLPRNQVFGSGTILDTTRLKDTIAQRAEVAPRSVHAYVVGEHGDSQTIAWSNITIGGIPMNEILPLDIEERKTVADFVRTKADWLNKIKGETSFGIGAAIATICTAILLDERQILPISHYQDSFEVCFNMPAVIGRRGLIKSLAQALPLDGAERASLERSASKLREIAHSTEGSAQPEVVVSRL